MQQDEAEPKGLIRESYRIEGISPGECRSILVDWALSLPSGADTGEALQLLLNKYGTPGHPMTEVLTEGLPEAPTPRRRGGRSGRMAKDE